MKPLVKHEFKRILLPALMLLAINCIVHGFVLNWNISSHARDYIIGRESGRSFIEYVMDTYSLVLIPNAAVIMWLVYSQFHEDKVEGTGDFIATLPYTQKDKFIKKVLIGMIAIFISFVISIIIQYTLFDTYFYYTVYESNKSIFKEELMALSGYANTLGTMVNGYLGLVIWYLFLVVFQYSIYNTVASIVMAISSILSIPYILAGISTYLEFAINFKRESIQPIIDVFTNIIMCVAPIQVKIIRYKDGTYGKDINALNNNYYISLLVFICIAIILFIIGKELAQKYGLRSRKNFMVNRVVEYIFKILATISAAMVPVVFFSMSLRISRSRIIILTLLMIVAGLIGYIISNKITMKGRE